MTTTHLDHQPTPEASDPTTSPATHDRGASIVEYALLIALIAVVCIGALSYLGTSTDSSYDRSTQSLFHSS